MSVTNQPRRFGPSKSKLTAFEQCPKRLWLSVHRGELAEQDEGAEARFATGHEVGALACALLPDGVMIEAEPDLAAALASTRALIDAGHDKPIFEATLEHDGVLVRIDVMESDGCGGWHMAEVKSSTKTKDYHLGISPRSCRPASLYQSDCRRHVTGAAVGAGYGVARLLQPRHRGHDRTGSASLSGKRGCSGSIEGR
jgi:hypothetical protein